MESSINFMLNKFSNFRTNIIPSDSVKILSLCLDDDENGILPDEPRLNTNRLEYNRDSILSDMIAQKIQQQKNKVEKRLKAKVYYNEELNLSLEKMHLSRYVPINLRKHFLYKTYTCTELKTFTNN